MFLMPYTVLSSESYLFQQVWETPVHYIVSKLVLMMTLIIYW